jgi:feruloyl-CoA synthase
MQSLTPKVDIVRRDNGELILTSGYGLGEVPPNLATLMTEQATKNPDRPIIVEKNAAEQFEPMTYGEAHEQAMGIATYLLDQGAGVHQPVMILSGASRAHFVVQMGACYAGVPVIPVSTSYTSVEAAFPKFESVFNKTRPAFLFAENPKAVEAAVLGTEIDLDGVECWSVDEGLLAGQPVTALEVITRQVNEAAVSNAIQALTHDTVAKYMFTSGSTGMPKGVIHTHGMICGLIAGQRALRDIDSESPPIVLDWMPWSHVGAGQMRLYGTVSQGGTIYLDDGKPTAADYPKTLANLRKVSITGYAGAPLGWSMLVAALEGDEALAEQFFANLQTLQYGSAAMPTSTYERLQALLVQYQGQRKTMSTSLMSTEVALGLSRYWPCEDQTVVGLPMPGSTFKLVPVGDRFEVRVRSLGVTPGYLNDPEKTQEAFDEEGFFKMGDAVTFADPERPEAGLRFAGRIAEQFKLMTGTWVSAGTLRAQLVAALAPKARDVVICGLNQSFIAILIWLNGALDEAADPSEPFRIDEETAGFIRQALMAHNAANPASSQRVERFAVMAAPASIGAGEITDKGYVNQGAVQARRQSLVELLFEPEALPGIFFVDDGI